MNRFARLFRHLVETRWSMRRRFSSDVLDRSEAAVRAAERTHRAEIRIVIETDLDAWSILAGRPPRDRALEVFATSGVWDTEENNGVLLYVLFADRDVEIVADRGYAGRVSAPEWETVCRAMEQEFRAARWCEGVIAGVEAASAIAARHYPAREGGRDDRNELSDRPALL
ncbi:MAG: TPM domain-containing protein [Pseudomonadota bacterium]